jgi:hypothetical protein
MGLRGIRKERLDFSIMKITSDVNVLPVVCECNGECELGVGAVWPLTSSSWL